MMLDDIPGLISIIASTLTLLEIARIRKRIQGTTFTAPVAWTAISIASILAVEVLIRIADCSSASTDRLRYIAAVSIFLPMMSLLGAKRPQDRGWQFIVGSLWLVLLLPTIQTIVFSSTAKIELHWAWSWFLLLLILIGLANHAMTRYGSASFLIAAGQTILLSNYLPGFGKPSGSWGVAICLTFCFLAVILITKRAIHRSHGRHGIGPFDRLWLDFRDAYGTVWALRIAERVNQLAVQNKWNVRLSWKGFISVGPSDSVDANVNHPEIEMHLPTSELEPCMRTLLRRFVNPEWITARLGENVANQMKRESRE